MLVVYVADDPLCTLVPPTLKLKFVPPVAVNVTLVPRQNTLSASELVSVGVGNVLTVFVIADDMAIQPLELVTITSTHCPVVSVLIV